ACRRSSIQLQSHPDIDRWNELARGRLTNVYALGGDRDTVLQIEAGPWLRHSFESHLLDGPPGRRVHDCCDHCHEHAVDRERLSGPEPKAHLQGYKWAAARTRFAGLAL